MQQEGLQDRLGEVLEASWSDLCAILADLEAILGRFGVGWGGIFIDFLLVFFKFFVKSPFCIKIAI